MALSLTVLLAATAVALPYVRATAQDQVPYGVAPALWPEQFGNHRLRIQVAEKADAVWAHLPWRRRDPKPQEHNVVVVNAATGAQVRNTAPVQIGRESGDIVFQAEAPGEYWVYYLPYTADMVNWAYKTTYAPPEATADAQWLERNGLAPARLAEGAWKNLPAAKVLEVQARTDFDRFDPMEVIATADEVKVLLAQHPDQPYLLFPEDRRFPIRMTNDLPARWMGTGPGPEFRGEARPGEFYVFQIGVFAARAAVEDLVVTLADLRPTQGRASPGSACHAFNFGGTDWLGRPMKKAVSVPQGKVQALWFGVQTPKDTQPGEYQGAVTLRPKGLPESTVKLVLTVAGEVLPDAGDGELWRLSRLRWLDSTIGLDDQVTAPYTPLKVQGQAISCLGRRVRFGEHGLLDSIVSGGHEVLAAPLAFVVETAEGKVAWTGGKPRLTKTSPGQTVWEATSRGGPFTMACQAKMEFDGYLTYTVRLKADQAAAVKDIRLEVPTRREIATYMMGLGRKGGYRPAKWQWTWKDRRANNTVWLGDVDAGLYCKLKGPEDTWDIYDLASLPQAWDNEGKGGCTVTEDGPGTVLIRAYSGPRAIQAGEDLCFRFGLLITPVKPLNSSHWQQRYYHAYVPVQTALDNGANIINVHHGNELNPYINYPFRTTDKLAAYVKQAHDKGVKVKIYYTVRELSNRVAEMWPLRSLGFEVFCDGGGGGHSWLQEHLVTHYASAWHQPFPNGEVDAAIATQGLSRWHNYYLEGLAWLLRHVQIDGLYLDGIGYDREIMRRVRKVMDRERPSCLIDFHSGNEFTYADMKLSPACKYMEHFPYIDSLWFGEGYDYNETPDYWLVEVSGLPFGLFGEMLQDNGNPWRGMVYGMSARYYSGADPKHIWKLWDDFGIQDAKMIGYWNSGCPVKTDHRDVFATAYCKQGKVLVSVASWAKDPVRCRLKLDWQKLGLNPQKAHLFAPAIQGFQHAALFSPTDEIPVAPARGWLLIVDEAAHQAPKPEDVYRGRSVLLEDRFDRAQLGEPWKLSLSSRPATSLKLQDGALAIEAAANCGAFADRPLPAGATLVECRIFAGTDKGASWGPGLALVWPQGCVRINLRAEGRYGVDYPGTQDFGGAVTPDAWYHLRIRLEGKEIVLEASADEQLWEAIGTLLRDRFPGDPTAVRIGKMSPGGGNEDYSVLGPAGACTIKDLGVWGKK